MVTSTEKKLVELYRAVDSGTRKAAINLPKGQSTGADDILSSLLSGAMDLLGNK